MTRDSIDDSRWYEVQQINSFAVFMGYLSTGVRGLSLLVVTWTTVVLLGGFVSDLNKKDFWSLTAITLIQTAGVFDFLIEEKSSDIRNSLMGLLAAVRSTVFRPLKDKDKGTSISGMVKPSEARLAVGIVLMVVQALVLAVVLCPLAVLYLLGLYISSGVALWRLIEHDYGNNTDEAANLKPALEVLYSLAVAQGVFFGYKKMYAWGARIGLVEKAASIYKLPEPLVSDYVDGTLKGCMKDPSFSRGRNLITYGVDLLMEPGSYLSGIWMIGTILRNSPPGNQDLLTKQLLTASSSYRLTILRLLDVLGPASPYSSELREHAATIVACVAGHIRLEQFPGGLESISSLVEPFEEYYWLPEGYERGVIEYHNEQVKYERVWLMSQHEYDALKEREGGSLDHIRKPQDIHGYKELVVQGLCILQELTVHDGNYRVISNTQGLISKILAPLISNKVHRDHHVEWSSIAEASVQLLSRLMATPGETEMKNLKREIFSGNNEKSIISTLGRIMESHKCEVLLKREAVQIQIILDQFSDATSSSITAIGSDSRRVFTWILLDVVLLTDDCFGRMWGSTHWLKKRSDIRKLAEHKLQAMLHQKSEGSATSMLPSVRAALGDLNRTLLDVHAENSTNRLHAAQILAHLYGHYDKYEYREVLKESMDEVLPEVLREILSYGSTRKEIAPHIDLEKGGVSHDTDQEIISSHQQNREEHEDRKLQEALILLCKRLGKNRDRILRWQGDEIARKICSEQKKHAINLYFLMEEAEKLLEKKAEESASGQASSPGQT